MHSQPMKQDKNIWGHASMFVACACWGLMSPIGKRPTVVSMYNYVQPIVACLVSVAVGLGVFGWQQGLAVALVFGGVWLVTQSKSRAQMKKENQVKTR